MDTPIAEQVLPAFGLTEASVSRWGSGLINETHLVEGPEARYVLQRVNPLFAPEIHQNIRAVTQHLQTRGLLTPQLRPTRDGHDCLALGEAGVWRVWNYIEGASFDVMQSVEQARSASVLVARFHRALDDLDHRFVGLRSGVHDTSGHLATLRKAVSTQRAHRLHAAVTELSEAVFAAARALPALPPLSYRICHGDLKLNNVLFAGLEPPDSQQALCLIDLDTVGPGSLAYELGDAWRSWCNRSGEDAERAQLDLDVLEASIDGYCAGLERRLSRSEAQALLAGPEWVSLELTARFAADALLECYFGWDERRYAGRGEHNLQRAQGQWSLHRAFVATRSQRAKLLGSAVH